MSTNRSWLYVNTPNPISTEHHPQDAWNRTTSFHPSPASQPHTPFSATPIITTTTTTNTITTNIRTNLLHPRPSPNRSTHTGLTYPPAPQRPLFSPLLAFAAYATLAVAALTGLAGLLLTGYGLSAFDDARRRLTGVRGFVGKSLDAGRELVDGAREVVEGVVGLLDRMVLVASSDLTLSSHSTTPLFTSQVSATSRSSHPEPEPQPQPQRANTHTNATHDRTPRPVFTSWNARAQPPSAGYNVPTEGDETEERPRPEDGWEENSEKEQDFDPSQPAPLPPRPPLTVLIGSLILTLIIVAGRLMVMWWMGQQVRKNTSRAFRENRRAHEASARRSPRPRPTW